MRPLAAVVASCLWLFVAVSPAGAAQHRFETEVAGCGSTNFVRAQAVALDPAGDLYVLDNANGSLSVLDPSGTCLEVVTGLEEPKDVAVDPAGVVYVIVASPPPFISRGQLVRLVPGSYPPSAETSYSAPVLVGEGAEGENLKSVAVDWSTDRVYVNRVTRIDEYSELSAGNTLLDSIGEGALTSGYGVAVNEATGDIYASSSGGSPIGVYRFDGSTHDLVEVNDGSTRPQGAFDLGGPSSIDIDQETGDVLVWDVVDDVISEFDEANAFVAQIGPTFGPGVSLSAALNPQLAVSNGVLAPNRRDVYVPSENAPPARVYIYGPLEDAKPIVTATLATSVTPTSAVLRGQVNPNGLETDGCEFEYVDEGSFGSTGFAGAMASPCAENSKKIGSGTNPVNVHLNLSGLTPGIYVYRLVASNENGSTASSPLRFGPAEAETLPAFPVGYTEAVLRGRVDANGLETQYHFEYGSDSSYGSSTDLVTLPAGAGASEVEAVVTGLLPGQAYHYRLVASNEAATASGVDRSFKTLISPAQESCPNAAFRSGLSALLPDCRAYELVSPAFTNGLKPFWRAGEERFGSFPTRLATADGSSVLYETEGTIPGTSGDGDIDGHRAIRGADGWGDSLYSPLAGQTEAGKAGGASPDHAYSFWFVYGNGTLPREGKETSYLRGPAGFEPIGIGSLGIDYEAIGRRITADASHVIFTSTAHLEPAAGPAGEEAIYDRTPGGATQVLSLLPNGQAASEVRYIGVSDNGTAVAFTAEVGGIVHLFVRRAGQTFAIASGEVTFAGLSQDGDSVLYVLGEELYRAPIQAVPSTQIASGGEATFVNVSADGSHAYFTSTEVLTAGEQNSVGDQAEAGQPNLYVWDAASTQIHFVATLAPSDLEKFGGSKQFNLGKWTESLSPEANGTGTGPAQDPSRTTPDGNILVFQSHADLTGYESGGHSQIYRYETGGDLSCVSCSPLGGAVGSEAQLEIPRFEDSSAPISALTLLSNVTTDGRMVFFMTSDPLVPEDVNHVQDVYEWREGQLFLISSGHSAGKSYLYAMTSDGHDVFLTTEESLVPTDRVEDAVSLYDARIGGGFPEPQPPTTCAGDACQPTMVVPPSPGSAATEGLSPEKAQQRPRHPCRKGTRRIRRHGHLRCVRVHHKKAKIGKRAGR